MGIFNRFLLAIYGLTTGIVFALIAMAIFNVFTEHVWLNELRFALPKEEVRIFVGVMLLFSVYFFLYALFVSNKKKSNKDFVLLKGENGDVKVAVTAVKNLVENVVLRLQGVRGVKVKVDAKGDNSEFSIKETVTLGEGVDAIAAANIIRQETIKSLADSLGIKEVPVDVSVEDFSNNKEKGRRVI